MTIIRNVLIVSALLGTSAAQALEVDREVLPRITLGGRVIGTLDATDLDSDSARSGTINSEDSEIALRMDKRLYENGVAGATLSFREDADAVHFANHYVFYWDENLNVVLGHAPLRNTLIEFSTVREDDLAYATHVLNASSQENFAQTHGDVASIDWFPQPNHAFGVSMNARSDDAGMGIDGIDSMGASYIYAPPDTLRYMTRVRRAGIILDRQQTRVNGQKYWMNSWITGAAWNLNDDHSGNWSLDAQLIRNQGVDAAAKVLENHYERARRASSAVVASLHYTARPALLTRWQAMLTVASKEFDDVHNSGQWSLAPGLTWRAGQGVDVLAQYVHTEYGSALGGGIDRVFQIGLAFSLEARFNDTIGQRNSILNLEHGYIR
ncbi:MAG: hypothetical protein HY273_07905 [Gammaproteobacteria bacterium]|nr:hypothetical protein [Gammaproteobacteria bacterium]